jgi:Mg-chelatase subunit ChlD
MDSTNKNLENMHLGENSHPQYNWSQENKEKILGFSFQLTENGGQNIELLNNLKNVYTEIVRDCFLNKSLESANYLLILYKLIAQTRDIINGKGIYSLTYMMIAIWANLDIHVDEKYKNLGHKLATLAMENCVSDKDGIPLGSWKDIKYFLNYFKNECNLFDIEINNHPVCSNLLTLVCRQLKEDSNSLKPSLLARWIPREKSNKFGWITPLLAYRYFPNYIITAGDQAKLEKARNKALMHFRQTITDINKKLNTVQIKQCGREWQNINFDKHLTSITLRKQSLAFQNKDKKGRVRNHNLQDVRNDRETCALNYSYYIKACSEGKKQIKSKNVSLIDLVRDADRLNNPYNYRNNTDNQVNETERMALNLQWIEQCKNTSELEDMIAMVDTSGSMECDNGKPLYSAIGLGLRVAEKSKFGKRVLTFSQQPTWINLENCSDFVECVAEVRKAPWGMNTNFYAALDLILQTAIKNNVHPDQLKKTTLVIFSDMQIDEVGDSKDSFFNNIKLKYREAGLKSVYKTPFPVPHIIFWNLRTTSGFPSLSSTPNTSMISGSSGNLLNLFLDKGTHVLEELTPWKLLQESLNNSRYSAFQNAFTSCLSENL